MHSASRTAANRALATVKSILILLASLTTTILVFVFGVDLASHVIAGREPHKFAHLDAPDLWTSRPVVIDPSRQHYERLAAVEQPVNVAASNDAAAPGMESLVAVENASPGEEAPNRQSQQASRLAPGETPSVQNASTVETGSQVSQARGQWCAARYSSYRPEDNTYQPFGGGSRRPCMTPDDVSGSSSITATGSGVQPAHDDLVAEDAGNAPSEMTVASASREMPDSGSDLQSASPDRQDPEARVMAISDGGGDGSQSGSHQAWCMARYHSYRASDDSYQPFDGGPRRACQSPMG